VLGSGGSAPIDVTSFGGTLVVDFDAANAVLSGGLVATMGAGLGTRDFVAAQAAPARPTLNASDPDFNGMPSVQFGEAGPLITNGAVTVGHNVLNMVGVVKLGATPNGRVIAESSPDANANARSFAMLHDDVNVRTNKSGANGLTCQRNRNVPVYGKLHYAMVVDFAQAGSAGIVHYQDGVVQATAEGFDNGATAGGPAGAYVWNFGARNGGAGQWFVSGKIARLLGFAGAVDHAGLYAHLASIYGA
jgi:hypothetical protein